MTESAYERRAREEIERWKTPIAPRWLSRIGKIVNSPFELAGVLLMNTPAVGAAIETAVGGLISSANDLAQWSIRPESILAEYRHHGHDEIASLEDIGQLDLQHIDRAIGWLNAKYKGIAVTEGAVAGLAGPLGIAADVAALVLLNLRAIGEYGTSCGFDMTSQRERLYAMHLLSLASSPTDASKATAMAQLSKIATEVARRSTWKNLEQHAFVKVVQHIAQALGVRLTKAKLAQIVPIAGAAIGAGFNAHFTNKVCDCSYYLFRERFLDNKCSS